MSKPRLLDLFSGAGGAAVGYARAGFEVVGVDIVFQKHYPFEFHQGDAMTWPLEDYDAVHASPPCQHWTHAKHIGNRGRSDHPQLIAPIRERLIAWGGPYVIENVEDAKSFLVSPVTLCGSSLGLPDLERHRCFESNVAMLVPPCAHGLRGLARFPGTPRSDGTRPLSRIANPMASGISHEVFASAMGIDWMPASGFRPSRELARGNPAGFHGTDRSAVAGCAGERKGSRMSDEVAAAIRQTRRTLAEKTWVPWHPKNTAGLEFRQWWNDRQTDVGAVLGMTLQALIAELCKVTLAPYGSEA